MERLIINGSKQLEGVVDINGSKNAAVAIIPGAILANDVCIIENVPDIEDVVNLVGVINEMGMQAEFIDKHTIKIDSRNLESSCANYEAVKEMRGSYYFLGALMGRFNKAQVPFPGGCNFGTRPIDQHIKGFEALGAEVVIEHGIINLNADKVVGTSVFLDVVTVGATINIMLASIFAEGVTTIENAAKEPHVVDTANFLNSMGANIKGAGTDVIKITGVDKLHGSTYMIIPDQIEAGTYMIAGAITRGDITVKNVIPKHMEALTAKLVEMGVEVIENDDEIRVIAKDKVLKNIKVKTQVYPGFPTDLQPQMSTLLATVKGTNIITESVFDNRFQYIDQLKKMGAKIEVEGHIAIIEGIDKLSGTEVKATDLRAGAAMVLAGLVTDGETSITDVKFIDRGYEFIEQKLKALGADIRRENN